MHWGEEDLTWKDVRGVVFFAALVIGMVLTVLVLFA